MLASWYEGIRKSYLAHLTLLSYVGHESRSFKHLEITDFCVLQLFRYSIKNLRCLKTLTRFRAGEALIAYVILMTVVGLPLFIMELGLGQFGRSGVIKLWLALPLLKGTIR